VQRFALKVCRIEGDCVNNARHEVAAIEKRIARLASRGNPWFRSQERGQQAPRGGRVLFLRQPVNYKDLRSRRSLTTNKAARGPPARQRRTKYVIINVDKPGKGFEGRIVKEGVEEKVPGWGEKF